MKDVIFDTLADMSMLAQFRYETPLSKERLVSLVEEVFPGVEKQDEQVASDHVEQLPPGIEIVAGNIKFFIASDKSIITLRGKPLTDDFLRRGFSHLQDWFKKAMPEAFTLLSYRELRVLPLKDGINKFSDVLADLPDRGIVPSDDSYCDLLYDDTRYLKDHKVYITSERAFNSAREKWMLFYRVTVTKKVALTSLDVVFECFSELKEIVRTECGQAMSDSYKAAYNE